MRRWMFHLWVFLVLTGFLASPARSQVCGLAEGQPVSLRKIICQLQVLSGGRTEGFRPVGWRGAVQGVVRDAGKTDGGSGPGGLPAPLSDARIRLVPAAASEEPDLPRRDSAPRVHETVTDLNGRFRLTDIPGGDYFITASKAGHQPAVGAVSLPDWAGRLVDLMLYPLPEAAHGTLMGSVVERTPDAAAYPPGPVIPVAGAAVHLMPAAPDRDPTPMTTGTSENGRFKFPPVPAGDYLLTIEADRYLPYERPVRIEPDLPPLWPVIEPPAGVTPDDQPPLDEESPGLVALWRLIHHAGAGFFCLGPHGHWHFGVNFAHAGLARPEPDPDAAVEGRVLTPDNGEMHPVAGARITVWPDFPFPTLTAAIADGAGFAPPPVYETVSDQEGRYRIEGIPPGDHRISAEAEPFPPVEIHAHLAPGENVVDLILQHPTPCIGPHDCPEPTFCRTPFGACDAEGVCEPRPEACPAYFHPVCGCDGKTYGNRCEAAQAGTSVAHEGECPPPTERATLIGRVLNGAMDCGSNADCPAGIPDAEIELHLLDPDPFLHPGPWHAVTDDDGTYILEDLPVAPTGSSDFHLFVHAPGFFPHEGTITLQTGGNRQDIDLMPNFECMDNPDCAAGAFCAKPPGRCDDPGRCQPQPEACIDLYAPVCGCDGNTYGNDCEAAANGVNVDYEGRCL